MGYASAVGLVLLVIALVINVIQLLLNGSFKRRKSRWIKVRKHPLRKDGNEKKNTFLSVLATAFFGLLGFMVIFPVFAGLLASFRPGRELIRRGLSINLDF